MIMYCFFLLYRITKNKYLINFGIIDNLIFCRDFEIIRQQLIHMILFVCFRCMSFDVITKHINQKPRKKKKFCHFMFMKNGLELPYPLV